MNRDWFLIADEVGLGKTRSAKGVIFEMMRLYCRHVRCMYIASSVDLANQNMAEFVCKTTDWLSELAGFQRNNVEAVMQKMFDDKYTLPDLSGQTSELELNRLYLNGLRENELRLSRFMPGMIEKNKSYIMQLSTKTSFSDDNEYDGSGSEKASLKRDYDNINKNSPLYDELRKAMEYEGVASVDVDNDFHLARRIRSNAAAALYKPDIIILDEFQRFRDILYREDGYSVLKMVRYLQNRYKNEIPKYMPKILLLSATPYKLDKEKIKIDWSYANGDKYKISDVGEDNLFDDLENLINNMNTLTGSTRSDRNDDCLVRTERPEKRKKIFIEMQQDRCVKHQKYLNSVIGSCVNEKKLGADDIDTICKYIYHTPSFWRFNAGYGRSWDVSREAKIKLLASGDTEENVYDNLSLRTLIEEVFGDELPRLWVPPVCAGTPEKGKTLVFTTLKMTTRSAAYYCNEYANRLIEKYTEFDDPDNASPDDAAEKLSEGIDWLKKAFSNFFGRSFVRRVIAANNSTKNWNCSNYSDAVLKYCDEFRFSDVIDEWLYIRKINRCDIDAVFTDLPAAVEINSLAGDKIIAEYSPLDYADMYVGDDAKSGGVDTDIDYENKSITTTDKIKRRFNSPFYPMVLVARSAAQEGLNLQYYGDKIMHWQFAHTPEAFLQREGRLDRPGSLTMRHKVWKWAELLTGKQPDDYKAAWDCVSAGCADEDSRIYTDAPNKWDGKGLVPMWYLELPECVDRDKYDIRQILAVYEYNDSLVRFAKGLDAALRYSEGL